MFFGPITHLLSVLCILMKSVEKKVKRVSDFSLLLVVFKWHHGSEGVKVFSLKRDQTDFTILKITTNVSKLLVVRGWPAVRLSLVNALTSAFSHGFGFRKLDLLEFSTSMVVSVTFTLGHGQRANLQVEFFFLFFFFFFCFGLRKFYFVHSWR